MVNELLKYAKKPEGPLQILQAELEMGIQLVVHTLHAYKVQYLQLPQGQIVSMTNLGYESRLCNMALVNAAASWDGFEGNIVHITREGGHSFSKSQLFKHLKQTSSYQHIIEPLARRHCIVHNLAKVDRDYKKYVPSSPLVVGASLDTNLSYLKDASVSFFKTACELVKLLVRDGLLAEECQKTIGEFQHDPRLEYESKITLEVVKMDENKKQFLEAMKVPEDTFDKLPSDAWFLSRGFPPHKVRLAFKCVEAPITFGAWTAITLSASDFFKLAAMIPELAKDMTKK
jgi:hypothetical protein